MKQIIKLNAIYGADLYTRSRASEIRDCISRDATEVTLDFDAIAFVSRSFADELCNILDDNAQIHFSFANCSAEVDTMLNKVEDGRKRERKRGISNAQMYKFEDMQSLSEFLLAM